MRPRRLSDSIGTLKLYMAARMTAFRARMKLCLPLLSTLMLSEQRQSIVGPSCYAQIFANSGLQCGRPHIISLRKRSASSFFVPSCTQRTDDPPAVFRTKRLLIIFDIMIFSFVFNGLNADESRRSFLAAFPRKVEPAHAESILHRRADACPSERAATPHQKGASALPCMRSSKTAAMGSPSPPLQTRRSDQTARDFKR